MTERKPPGVSFETWIDKQVREATERGEMDDLPGAGKPLSGLGGPQDEQWWLKQYLAREGLSGDGLLPESLQLRKELERLPAVVRELLAEDEVRGVVAELNLRIVAWMRMPSGPQIVVGLADADEVVARWREERPAPEARPVSEAAVEEAAVEEVPTRGGWWRRVTRKLR
ncbi:J-domain-containing protein [Amycolatopsis sp. H20-H5]|uniref:DnaJ family domain-containing protein n=1 Tax=Amycolatopsis sp. H20-H5 TaxID=3046309 RepID=UPI002DBFA711|nr:DUF1992 domain-containing protein [Amycolatopsis sp. H20-H5]MEC3974833.1 DUF1992 domain-containing protein [Amycolatopsis sp. H20-H5]